MTIETEGATSAKPERLNGTSPRARHNLIDQVDVTVEAYIGEALLTLGGLNALKSGDIVNLNASLNALVELRVNGVAIAEGELVSVGDKFGVRIVSIS
ncbi:MAG: FliM/FliN family flagellar motor switch protein [Hyphomonadaceae bacterium]